MKELLTYVASLSYYSITSEYVIGMSEETYTNVYVMYLTYIYYSKYEVSAYFFRNR